MSKIFVTSDLHLCHNRDFLFEPRGFSSTEEHAEAIVRFWNETVAPEDIVYILGDLMLNDNDTAMSYLRQLNGHLKICRGNHDSDTRISLYKSLSNVEYLGGGEFLHYKKYTFYLSHYPTLTSNWDTEEPLKVRVISLCGHTHTKDKFCDWNKGLIYHCELDAHNNKPVLLDNIIKDIKEKMHNEQ